MYRDLGPFFTHENRQSALVIEAELENFLSRASECQAPPDDVTFNLKDLTDPPPTNWSKHERRPLWSAVQQEAYLDLLQKNYEENGLEFNRNEFRRAAEDKATRGGDRGGERRSESPRGGAKTIASRRRERAIDVSTKQSQGVHLSTR